MFAFVVKWFGFLKGIPLVAVYYDSLIKMWMLVSNPKMLSWVDELEDFALTFPQTDVSLHKYGGSQFNYNDKEFAHLHSNGILDLLFNRELKTTYLEKGRIQNHHVFQKSGWISFHIKTVDDVSYAKELLAIAYQKRV